MLISQVVHYNLPSKYILYKRMHVLLRLSFKMHTLIHGYYLFLEIHTDIQEKP